MAHNIEVSIHSLEQAEELSRRLHMCLSRIDDRPPERRYEWYMQCLDDASTADGSGPVESIEKKANRIQKEDKTFWIEVKALLNFLKCEDLNESVRTFELSKDNNRQKMQHFFIPTLSEYLEEEHSMLHFCHPVVLELLLRLDLIPDILQILKLRPKNDVMKSFTNVGEGDHWLSVHYHCIRLFCYLLNAYGCKGCEEPRSNRPLINLMQNEGGIQVLLKCVETCKNPREDTAYVTPGLCAIVALYDIISMAPSEISKLLIAANGIQTLAYFIYRNNTLNVLNRIFKRKKLYKFEEYAMKALPWYSLPRSLDLEGKDPIAFTEDMSTHEMSYVWAYYLRIYSISILQSIIDMVVDARKILTEDKLCMKAIMDWIKCPQRQQCDQLTVEFTVKLVFYLVQTSEIAKLLTSNYHLLTILEAVVFFPSPPIIIHGYLEIIACLLNEPSLKDNIIEREELVFAMSNYAFSLDEKLRNMALTNLLRMSSTNSNGAKNLIKYFGPREINVYHNTFTKTKGKWKTLLRDYMSNLSKANFERDDILEKQKAVEGFPNRLEAVELKEKGNKLFKEGQYEKAIEEYSRAILLCPFVQINTDEEKRKKIPYLWESLRATIISNRAQCYMNLKKYKEALADCNRVVALSGHEENNETIVVLLKGLFRRAQTLYELKYYHRSLADINKCLLLDASNKKFKDFLGKVLIRYRKRYGPEVLLNCDECGDAGTKKLLRCKKCTAVYCSYSCQAKAWTKFHKAQCEAFNKEYPNFGK